MFYTVCLHLYDGVGLKQAVPDLAVSEIQKAKRQSNKTMPIFEQGWCGGLSAPRIRYAEKYFRCESTKVKKDVARGHPPYYWPRLNTLDFLDRTG